MLEFGAPITALGLSEADLAALDLPFLGRSALLDNKRTTGRAKGRADVESLAHQEDAES